MSSSLFLCLFINAVLSVPLLLARNYYPEFVMLTNITAIGGLNLLVLTFIYYHSSSKNENKGKNFLMHYPLFLVVYLAMSAQNAIAVIQGLIGLKSAFIRTPKFSINKTGSSSYMNNKLNWLSILEIAMLLYFIYAIGLSIFLNDYFMLLFFVMMSGGLGILVFESFAEARIKTMFNQAHNIKLMNS